MKSLFKMLLAVVLIAACSCQKEEILTNNTEQTVIVTADAGVQSFGVTTPGAWSVSMDEASQEWCEFVGPTEGYGQGAFSVKYAENEFDGVRRGLRRQAVFTVITGDQFTSITIYFRQSGITPKLTFRESAYTVNFDAEESVLPINTNLSVFEAPQIQYSIEGEWISGCRLNTAGTELILNHSINESEEVTRTATATISYTDSWGETFTASAELTQLTKPIIPDMFEPVIPDQDDDDL